MPLPSETVDWAPMSAGEVAVTVTPGSTPPWLSRTVPMMRVVPCADASAARSARAISGVNAKPNMRNEQVHDVLLENKKARKVCGTFRALAKMKMAARISERP